ncbi:hypothetical protein HDU96_000627 [Phlyctochytrium bullatum]|nr:hypothetical protein HDU96_000627 [Phlyctochytrium bullatum]
MSVPSNHNPSAPEAGSSSNSGAGPSNNGNWNVVGSGDHYHATMDYLRFMQFPTVTPLDTGKMPSELDLQSDFLAFGEALLRARADYNEEISSAITTPELAADLMVPQTINDDFMRELFLHQNLVHDDEPETADPSTSSTPNGEQALPSVATSFLDKLHDRALGPWKFNASDYLGEGLPGVFSAGNKHIADSIIPSFSMEDMVNMEGGSAQAAKVPAQEVGARTSAPAPATSTSEVVPTRAAKTSDLLRLVHSLLPRHIPRIPDDEQLSLELFNMSLEDAEQTFFNDPLTFGRFESDSVGNSDPSARNEGLALLDRLEALLAKVQAGENSNEAPEPEAQAPPSRSSTTSEQPEDSKNDDPELDNSVADISVDLFELCIRTIASETPTKSHATAERFLKAIEKRLDLFNVPK